MEPRHILLSDGHWLSIGSSECACNPSRSAGWQDRGHGYCANYAVIKGTPHPPTHWAAISPPPGPPTFPAWVRVPRAITLHHLAETAARHIGHEELGALIEEAR